MSLKSLIQQLDADGHRAEAALSLRRALVQDMMMTRMDSDAKPIAEFKWEVSKNIDYEEIKVRFVIVNSVRQCCCSSGRHVRTPARAA